MKYPFHVKKDVLAYCEAKYLDLEKFSLECGITRETLYQAFKNETSLDILEKIYSSIYESGFPINKAKCELFVQSRNRNSIIVYHGSKFGVDKIDIENGNKFADFSNGFYSAVQYETALSFIEYSPNSSIYVFEVETKGLNVLTLDYSLDWILLICFYRGYLNKYPFTKQLDNLIKKVKKADIIVAPVINNKMLQVISQFANGEITSSEVIHTLNLSRLGSEYVFKTEKAVDRLKFKDRLYVAKREREDALAFNEDNSKTIDSKLYLARREYRYEGKFIKEILK